MATPAPPTKPKAVQRATSLAAARIDKRATKPEAVHSPQPAFIKWFGEITIDDVPLVGGKNASLGSRLGSRRVEQVLAEVLENGATNYWDEKDCEKIIAALKWTSLCGLGIGLAEFAESALRHYGKELELCLR